MRGAGRGGRRGAAQAAGLWGQPPALLLLLLPGQGPGGNSRSGHVASGLNPRLAPFSVRSLTPPPLTLPIAPAADRGCGAGGVGLRRGAAPGVRAADAGHCDPAHAADPHPVAAHAARHAHRGRARAAGAAGGRAAGAGDPPAGTRHGERQPGQGCQPASPHPASTWLACRDGCGMLLCWMLLRALLLCASELQGREGEVAAGPARSPLTSHLLPRPCAVLCAALCVRSSSARCATRLMWPRRSSGSGPGLRWRWVSRGGRQRCCSCLGLHRAGKTARRLVFGGGLELCRDEAPCPPAPCLPAHSLASLSATHARAR